MIVTVRIVPVTNFKEKKNIAIIEVINIEAIKASWFPNSLIVKKNIMNPANNIRVINKVPVRSFTPLMNSTIFSLLVKFTRLYGVLVALIIAI